MTSNVPCLVQTLGPYLNTVNGGVVQSAQYFVGPSGVSIPINSFFGGDIANINISLMSVPSQDPGVYRSLVSNSNGTALTVAKSGTTDNSNTTYSYNLTASNASGSTATGTTTITDTLPPEVDFVSASGTGWTVSVSGGVLTATSTTSQNTATSFPVLTVTIRAQRAVNVAWSANGWFTDFDVFADLPAIVWCGTSITSGAGATTYAKNFPYLIRNWFRDTKGINTRVTNRAIDGSTSTHHEYLRASNGRYSHNEPPFMVFWEHGINDVSQGLSTATTQANLTAWLKYWNTFYPSTWCVVLAPWPTGGSTNESSLVTLRAAIASTMSTTGGSKNIYVSGTGSMFSASTQSSTYTTDNVHLNDAGCALAATTIQSALTSYF
jgi:lysophospholipase L1-like esterase